MFINNTVQFVGEKLLIVRENNFFKFTNTRLNGGADGLANIVDNFTPVKVFVAAVTNPAANLMSRTLVLYYKDYLQQRDGVLLPKWHVSAKHYAVITLSNMNTLSLIGLVSSRILWGGTNKTDLVLAATLIFGRIVAKCVKDRSCEELKESDFRDNGKLQRFVDKAADFVEGADAHLEPPYMKGGDRLLGIFKSYPIEDFLNKLSSQ